MDSDHASVYSLNERRWGLERRLAAILAADVVGYSRLMGQDETDTLKRLMSLQKELLQPKITDRNGRIVKLMGDGLLAEFPSVVEAVQCAVDIQESISGREPDVPEERRVKLRIGVNLGDIIVEDLDIYGEGVNVAARLEGISQPGGIAISEQVFYSLDSALRGIFCNGGDYHLKNINRSVQVWHWPDFAPHNAMEKNTEQDSVPIISLEQFHQSGDSNACSDLAAELRSELMDALSHRSGVLVATKADECKAPTYVLNGRCHVIGERCRLYLSLIVAANGQAFWSTKVDGEVRDFFGFIDDTVAKINTGLRAHMNAYGGALYAAQPDEELTVQQLLSKAAFLFYHVDQKNVEQTRRTMETAIARAPKNPMALAMHSYAIMQTVPLAIERVSEIDVKKAMSFADRAIYHGSNVDFVHYHRGRTRLWLRRDHEGCRADANRALTINPDYHGAKEALALADLFGGRIECGISELKALLSEVAKEPYHTPYRHSMLGIAYRLLGDKQAAIYHGREGYEQKPFLPIHALAHAVAASGETTIINSAEFRAMIDHHALKISDADRLPFALESDHLAVADLLRRSGLQE